MDFMRLVRGINTIVGCSSTEASACRELHAKFRPGWYKKTSLLRSRTERRSRGPKVHTRDNYESRLEERRERANLGRRGEDREAGGGGAPSATETNVTPSLSAQGCKLQKCLWKILNLPANFRNLDVYFELTKTMIC